MKYILMMVLALSSCANNTGESTEKVKFSQVRITTELSEEEKEGLLFMWEEEKLARDVYLTLGQRYGDQTLMTISDSEQKHMNAVKGLLDQLAISLPIDGGRVGVFNNSEIQSLYFQLIRRGEVSQIDALEVGREIELLDIEDLRSRLDQTDDPRITKVYSNLLNASYNHLSSFEVQLRL